MSEIIDRIRVTCIASLLLFALGLTLVIAGGTSGPTYHLDIRSNTGSFIVETNGYIQGINVLASIGGFILSCSLVAPVIHALVISPKQNESSDKT